MEALAGVHRREPVRVASIRPRVHHPWRARRRVCRDAVARGFNSATGSSPVEVATQLRGPGCRDLLQFGHGFITRGGRQRQGKGEAGQRASIRPRVHHPWRLEPDFYLTPGLALQFGHGFITRGGPRRSCGSKPRRRFNSATGSSPVEGVHPRAGGAGARGGFNSATGSSPVEVS